MREQQNEQRGFFSALRLSGAILILTIGLVTHQSWSEGLPETGGEEETVRSAFATDKADQGRETTMTEAQDAARKRYSSYAGRQVPTRGHEFSFTTGFMFNTKNDATDYSSGTEWHMDFMLAQHFSKVIAVGLDGSVLRGITDDSGALLNRANATLSALGLQSLGGFRAEFLGLGPALLLSPTIGNTTVNFVVKYLVRVLNENRFDGNYVSASVALKF